MEQVYRRLLSGQQTGLAASFLRGLLRLVEPVYRAVVASRNSSYSTGVLKSFAVARPVISVGNITTGGTGKTPVVRWLAERLRCEGFRPAILMRGYKSAAGAMSDEQTMLDELLNRSTNGGKGTVEPIVVHADADRVAGAQTVLREHPDVNVLILDDGFQHRRLRRDFDLVLIDATNPFGFDHVLPRGLLREPMDGLGRASAILLTRVDQALPDELVQIQREVGRCAPAAPVFRSNHAQAAILCEDAAGRTQSRPIESLRGRRVFPFCGIGNPEAFERQLENAGAQVVGRRWFGDHHDYTRSDLSEIREQARSAGAEALVTTEKDWVKVSPLLSDRGQPPPIWRVRLELSFVGNDETRLLEMITRAIQIHGR